MNVKFIKSKKFLFIILAIATLLVIISIIFSKKSYETINIGNNNLNKTLEEVEDYILNIKEYTATIEVTVNSNKNSNKYLIKQNHKEKNDEQEVLEPDTISNLNLEKIYNNYPYIESNILWLNSFIEEYRNSEQRNITEKNEEIVMQIKRKNDKKIATEELILDKKTLKPTKLSIMDNSKNVIVYILYNEIEIK